MSAARLDVAAVRRAFPILTQEVRGKPLIYLDTAATAQRPQAVIDAVSRFYGEQNANVHRGVHALSERATAAFEGARERLRSFLNAASTKELIFTRGTTESINLVANSYGRGALKAGDEVLITGLEHHSNIVPWQMLCEATGATLKVAPIDDRGDVDLEGFEALLGERTRICAMNHVSNALGTINPVKEMIALAKAAGAVTLLDGAQALAHGPVDVQDLGCDFYALSAHKVYGPTGIGALYGREALLEAMPPWQGGGDMILSVTFEKTTWNRLPYKFEAGTPNIAGAVGLGAALEWLEGLGWDAVRAHEAALLEHGTKALEALPGLRLIGTAREKTGVLSFVLENIHPHDIGTILDREGIAIRTGHHCAQPLMQRFGIGATARASLGVYNTAEELDALVVGLRKVQEVLG